MVGQRLRLSAAMRDSSFASRRKIAMLIGSCEGFEGKNPPVRLLRDFSERARAASGTGTLCEHTNTRMGAADSLFSLARSWAAISWCSARASAELLPPLALQAFGGGEPLLEDAKQFVRVDRLGDVIVHTGR